MHRGGVIDGLRNSGFNQPRLRTFTHAIEKARAAGVTFHSEAPVLFDECKIHFHMGLQLLGIVELGGQAYQPAEVFESDAVAVSGFALDAGKALGIGFVKS